MPSTRKKVFANLLKNQMSTYLLIVVGIVSSLVGFNQKALSQDTELPVEISLEDNSVFFLVTPEQNTNLPAYGAQLTIYDVHFAKMFEVTQHFCVTQPERTTRYIWIYENDNGSTRVGTFDISCDLANDIAIAYGSGKPEETDIGFCRGGGGCPTQSYSIPILNITGGKVDTWQNFVSRLRPSQ